MNRKFIRFGEIPSNEKSTIFSHQEPVGEENGVSVYEAVQNMHGDWMLLLPSPITEKGLTDFMYYIQYYKGKAYLVDGEVIGIGSDKEPLLRNVKVISKVHLNYD